MGKVLYVFPHPDDESFGPAPAIARQRREGHEVHLLTLTRGEATSQRHRLGYSLAEMGEARFREMQDVASALDLSGMDVLEMDDGSLAHVDPRKIERVVADAVGRIRPDVLVTYAIHGISGHPDHLAVHPAVKRVFCEMKERLAELRRLAFFTLKPEGRPQRPVHLKGSPRELIDCIVTFDASDHERAARALASYVTYAPVIEEHDPLGEVADGVHFEFFDEDFDPPVGSLFDGLDGDL